MEIAKAWMLGRIAEAADKGHKASEDSDDDERARRRRRWCTTYFNWEQHRPQLL